MGNEQGGSILNQVVRGLVPQCFADPELFYFRLLLMTWGLRAIHLPPNLIYVSKGPICLFLQDIPFSSSLAQGLVSSSSLALWP